MKIGVIGNGVVGNATARCFMEHGEVRVFDRDPKRSPNCGDSTLECDIIFVCTPEAELDRLFSYLGCSDHRHRNFVIKSTCPIGTTRKLAEKYGLSNLVHSPEFLTARCAVTDAQLPARNIIGIPCGSLPNRTTRTDDCEFRLTALYADRFPGVPIYTMRSDESEAVKLFQNSFFAVKVAFFNEINELATELGLDWETIRRAILADGRIAHSHTAVPGPDGKYGFGGTCLPKDLAQLIRHLESSRVNGPLVSQTALHRNVGDRERR